MKTVIRGALLCLALSIPALAETVDKSGVVTLGGTAQNAIASNGSRKGWCIQNPSDATKQGIATAESLWVKIGGTASATSGTELQPGAQVCNAPEQKDLTAVSVYGATTAHAWLGFETQ